MTAIAWHWRHTAGWVAGIGLLHQFPQLPDPLWAGLGALPMMLAAARGRLPAWILLALAGFCWAWWHAYSLLERRVGTELEGETVLLTGRVVSIPRSDALATRFEFQLQSIAPAPEAGPPPRRLRLAWYRDAPRLIAGQRWRLRVRWRAPGGFQNPGGFDFEGWMYRQGLDGSGYVVPHADNRRLGVDPWSLSGLRQGLAERLEEAVADPKTAALLRALAVGDRSLVTAGQWRVLSQTGTAHLLAISGLHVGLLSGLGWAASAWLWARSRRLSGSVAAPRAAALGGMAAAVTYAALAGFSIPTQRALIMVAVLLGARLLARSAPPGRSLALALTAVTAWDPAAVIAPGLWLSFGAVAAVLLGLEARRRQTRWRRWGHVHWTVSWALLPLTLVIFQQASLVAPLANALAIPVIAVLVPALLLGVGLLGVSAQAAAWLLNAVAQGLDYLWTLLDLLARLPYSHMHTALTQPAAVVCALGGMLLLLAPRGFPGRPLGLVLLPAALWAAPAPPPPGEARLTVLDVGQGLAAVVRTRNHTLVYDAGARFSQRFNAGAAVVVPYLRQAGIGVIDTLLISHDDGDHAGGVAAVMDAMPVHRLLGSGKRERRGQVPEPCAAGQTWLWDDVAFSVLHPPTSSWSGSENDRSCVVRVQAGDGVALLSGDIQDRGERQLLRHHGAALRADVLVVPHHGSATSSSDDFVQAVRPRLALVSAGHRNPFGFPATTVVDRYHALHARVLNTAELGAVEVHLGADVPVRLLHCERVHRRRFWHRPLTASATAGCFEAAGKSDIIPIAAGSP